MFNLFESKEKKIMKKLLFGTEKERDQVLKSKDYAKLVEQAVKDREDEKNNPPKYWGILFDKETKKNWPDYTVCGFKTVEEINNHSSIAKDNNGNSIYFEDSSQACSYRDVLVEKLDLGYMVGYAKSAEKYVVYPLLGMPKQVSDRCEIYRTKFGADNAAVKLNNEMKEEFMIDMCKKCSIGIACTKICDKFFDEIEGQPFNLDFLYFINKVGDKDANDKFLDFFKNAEKCFLCGHENVIIVEDEGDVCMVGYCEDCETLYIKSDGMSDGMFNVALKDDHSFSEDREEDLKDGSARVITFKEAIKYWKDKGVI